MNAPLQPEPFLRGTAFPPGEGVPYPRANPDDRLRLPGDTWATATLPVGVRLEFAGDAREVEIAYRTGTDDLGYRGDGAGRTFAAWRGDTKMGEEAAVLGEGKVRLPLGAGTERAVVYLPEGMMPTVLSLRGIGGELEPAPAQPRWLAYGDSITEGWIASEPALAWPAIAGRSHHLDPVNLGYAGAARGEIVSAEQLAALEADVITIAHGTNCWTRIPHSAAYFRAGLELFLDAVRQGHPRTPLLVVSPVIRPDAEAAPNRFGTTLSDLRAAMEEVAEGRIAAGDDRLELARGLELIDASQLGDGVHPDDGGHRAMAAALGPRLAALVG